jgi:predicted MPP superfamily phosphohydrolase
MAPGLPLPSRTGGWLRAAGIGLGTGVAAVAYGALIERNAFMVRREQVACLPAGSAPLRVLHLSDIHLSLNQRKKSAWLQGLAQLKPDLVVNTGDNLSHPEAIKPLLAALKPLLQVPGVFVPGSNDYFAPTPKNPFAYLLGPSRSHDDPGVKKIPPLLDTEAMHAGFDEAGWVNLTNRSASILLHGMRLDFSGVDDPHLQRERYAGWPAGTVGEHAAPSVRIALAHAPYQRVLNHFTAEEADLILAGHTHGGQLCVPGYGALVSNCDLPTKRARGLHDWEFEGHRSPVNVSAGIGTSRYAPIRFACRPEAVLLTLVAR